jgi:hypothetical protein
VHACKPAFFRQNIENIKIFNLLDLSLHFTKFGIIIIGPYDILSWHLGPLRDPMQRRTSAPAMTALITKPDGMHLTHHSSKGCQKNAPKTASFSATVPWA